MSLSGPNGLLMHLCKKHLEPGRSQKDFLAQPEFHKKKKEQRLRRKVYDTLFDNLEGPHRYGVYLSPILNPCVADG